MEIINLKDYVLEIDREETCALYNEIIESDSCHCLYCKNYKEACEYYSREVKDFFDMLGINVSNPREVYYVGEDKAKNALYGGFYHLCGRIIEGTDCTVKNSNNFSTINLTVLSDRFKYGFTNNIALISKNHKEPILQLEIEAHIPWVLRKKPEMY